MRNNLQPCFAIFSIFSLFCNRRWLSYDLYFVEPWIMNLFCSFISHWTYVSIRFWFDFHSRSRMLVCEPSSTTRHRMVDSSSSFYRNSWMWNQVKTAADVWWNISLTKRPSFDEQSDYCNIIKLLNFNLKFRTLLFYFREV